MSKQRTAVLEVLENSHGHLTAEEIFTEVRKIIPHISYSTVYRNLGVLAEEQKIHKITLPSDSDVFDKTPTSHGHLICRKCKKVTDIPFSVTDKAVSDMKSMGYDIGTYCFMAEHLCDLCRELSAE